MSEQHSSFFRKHWMRVLLFWGLVSACLLTLYRISSFDREYYDRAVHSAWKGTSAESDGRTLIAVVVCTRSNEGWKDVNETALHTLLVPSIEKTVTSTEWEQYRVELVAAFDKGDVFWENNRHRQNLANSTNISISFVSILKTRPHHIPFNEACRSAYEYGADYIVRVNDDTEFVTPGWITHGIQTLSNYTPPYVGVVGPTCREGNPDILTHDMVHRTHLDIFADYYPKEFDNWFVDDWITHVYGPQRTTRISNWTVRHHINKHGTRYEIDRTQRGNLNAMLRRGELRIRNYLHNGTNDPTSYQVLKSPRLDIVEGPMAALHERLKEGETEYNKEI